MGETLPDRPSATPEEPLFVDDTEFEQMQLATIPPQHEDN
jgi:hypothetical protein